MNYLKKKYQTLVIITKRNYNYIIMKKRKLTSTFILIELVISIAASVFVFYFQDILKIESFANQLIIILLFVGFFITISTYILKNHITFENQEQNEEHKRNFEIVRLIAVFQQKINDEERLNLANKKIKKVISEIAKLIDGNWTIVGVTDIDIQIKNDIAKTKTSILATHKCPENWESPSNQAIFAENEKAIKEKGIKIKRVFLLSNSDIAKFEKIKIIMKKHSEIGVDVLCVRAQDLKTHLSEDFLIYDRKKVIIEDIVEDKTEYERALVTVNKEDVNSWITKFDHILNYALNIEEFEKIYVKESVKH